MSSAVAKVAVALVANTKGFSDGMQRAQKEVRTFGESVRKEQSTFKQLQAGLGEGSGIGQLGKLMAGGGAAAGAVLLARHLATVASEMGKIGNEIRRGEAGLGDMTEAAIGLIPYFGSLWKAGREIQIGLSDAAAGLAQWAGFSQSFVESLESWETKLSRLQDENKIVVSLLDAARESRNRLTLAGLDGIAREKEAVQQSYAAQNIALQKLANTLNTIQDPANRFTANALFGQMQRDVERMREIDLGTIDTKAMTADTKTLEDVLGRLQEESRQLREMGLTGIAKERQAIENRYDAELDGIERLREAVRGMNDERRRIEGEQLLGELAQNIEAQRKAALADLARTGRPTAPTGGPTSIPSMEARSVGSTDLSKFTRGNGRMEKHLAELAAYTKVMIASDREQLRQLTAIVQALTVSAASFS